MESISVSKCQKNVLSFLFIVVVFFLTRQVPLVNYSFIMNIALALFFLFGIKTLATNIKKTPDIEFIFYFNSILLFLLVLYSLLRCNEYNLIIRFFLILFLIVLAYYVKPNIKYINIFLILILIQALFVIGVEIFLLLKFNIKTYSPIRIFFINHTWGDVYIRENGLLWKVQLRGNSLLPFACFVSLIYLSGKKRVIIGTTFLIATLFAGNFAFILGLCVFSFLYALLSIRWTYQKMIACIFLLTILICLAGGSVLNYIKETVAIKSVHSNPMRLDQAEVLIDDLSYDIKSTLLGRGLGNTISKKTFLRDYTSHVYYELQSLYVLNQVGILYYSLFIFINIFLAILLIKNKILLAAYLAYILYAFFNPYLLDTNHIVVIIVLISLKEAMDARQRKNICTHNCLQPGYL
jgi:hypothetical protein